jgi:transcriptional regulator with XRE-family HTH domain
MMTPFERKRLAVGLTQKQLAKKVGVDQSTVSRWGKNECIPEPQHFPKLARIFRMTPEEVTHLFDPEHATSAA